MESNQRVVSVLQLDAPGLSSPSLVPAVAIGTVVIAILFAFHDVKRSDGH